jgi:twitching motility protein PilT
MRLNETVPQISLSELLRKLSELGGSDLHITTGSPPQVRVDGHLRPLEMYRVLTSADTKQLAYSVLTDAQKHRFEENLELDFSFGVKGLSRFRANLFNQRGAVGAVFRAIPYEIKAFEELGLPVVVKQLCEKPRGLILVTGPTGSGCYCFERRNASARSQSFTSGIQVFSFTCKTSGNNESRGRRPKSTQSSVPDFS